MKVVIQLQTKFVKFIVVEYFFFPFRTNTFVIRNLPLLQLESHFIRIAAFSIVKNCFSTVIFESPQMSFNNNFHRETFVAKIVFFVVSMRQEKKNDSKPQPQPQLS